MIETRFKDAELCMIPEDWTSGTFQDFLATFSSGATPYRGIPDNFKGDVRWISSGELNYNTIVETIEHISKEAVVRTNLKMHQPGTFLMAITGLEAAGTRGRCAIIGKPSTTNQSCLAINSTDKMGTDYLYWFYNFWSETLAFKFAQGTKQQSFTAEIVRKLPIYCPKDKSEQTRIATALSNVDALISELGKLIEKKRAIKQGAMQQLLTGKKRLKGFTELWVEKKLGDISDIRTGKRNGDEQKDNGLYPFFVRSQTVYRIDTYSYEGEAIIIPGEGGIGKIFHYINGKFDFHQRVYKISDFPVDICVKFIYYYMIHFFGNYALQNTVKATVDSLRLPTFQSFVMTIPPCFREQSAIASVLTSIDNEISALEAKRDKYTAIKQGMMQQLLTGKIRLID